MENIKTQITRDLSLDFIKVLSMFLVVLLHTINKESSWAHYLIYCIGVFAIPLFFMVDGALLLNKKEITFKYCLKRILNILIICFFWSIIGFIAFGIVKKDFSNWQLHILGWFIQEGHYSIFWFFGSLIIIYVCLPLLHKIYKIKTFLLLLLIISTAVSFSFYFISLFTSLKYDYVFEEKIIQTFRLYQWLMYFLFGGIIYAKKESFLKITNQPLYFKIPTIVLLFMLGTTYCFFVGKYVFTDSRCEYQYSSIPIVILAIALFLLLITLKINTHIFYEIARTNIGVYATHYTFVFPVFSRILGFSIWVNLFFPLLIYICCVALSYLVLKIRYVRKIITI